jgi:Na+:H+ antiporter, NhaA family
VLADLAGYARERLSAADDEELDEESLLLAEEKLEDLAPPLPRLIHALHPLVAFVIMPLFALANSGLDLRSAGPGHLVDPVALGVGLGLVVGKPLGIVAATALAVRLGLAALPDRADWWSLTGVGIIGGIGFTVALFIAALAYPGMPELLDQAKLGILVGSALAGVAGTLLLRLKAA